MPVSSTFRTLVLDQLGRVAPQIRAKTIFGDALYLKVDESNRPDYEARGLGPFRPYGPDGEAMQYYPLPAELLEDTEELRAWVDKAIAVGRQKKGKHRNRPRRADE